MLVLIFELALLPVLELGMLCDSVVHLMLPLLPARHSRNTL